jgi:general secretion pathway protein G
VIEQVSTNNEQRTTNSGAGMVGAAKRPRPTFQIGFVVCCQWFVVRCSWFVVRYVSLVQRTTNREPRTTTNLPQETALKETALMRTHVKRAFTLIEILIVVVILGILAAIVIPQFTSASQEAQDSSIRSQLQTVRSQVELFHVQHPTSAYPDFATNGWDEMTDSTANPMGNRYLQGEPRNALLSNNTGVIVGLAVPPAASGGDLTPVTGDGWYFSTTTNTMYAIDAAGLLLDW